jgi:hypothetical protein
VIGDYWKSRILEYWSEMQGMRISTTVPIYYEKSTGTAALAPTPPLKTLEDIIYNRITQKKVHMHRTQKRSEIDRV